MNSWDFDADISPGSTHASKYAGNLYGPRTGLEAAGWWHMVRDNRARADYGSLIGSFGAACTEGCDREAALPFSPPAGERPDGPPCIRTAGRFLAAPLVGQ